MISINLELTREEAEHLSKVLREASKGPLKPNASRYRHLVASIIDVLEEDIKKAIK